MQWGVLIFVIWFESISSSVHGIICGILVVASSGSFVVDSQSNRMGIRLTGEKLISPNFEMVSSPVIQASVGLPLNSELTLRYLPEYSRNNIYFSNYGIGFKHDLLQYFSFLKKILK